MHSNQGKNPKTLLKDADQLSANKCRKKIDVNMVPTTTEKAVMHR